MKIENLLRQNIKTIKAYSSARDEYKDASSDMVFIDANENPFKTNVNRYPDPQQTDVKQRLAEVKGVSTTSSFHSKLVMRYLIGTSSYKQQQHG